MGIFAATVAEAFVVLVSGRACRCGVLRRRLKIQDLSLSLATAKTTHSEVRYGHTSQKLKTKQRLPHVLTDYCSIFAVSLASISNLACPPCLAALENSFRPS